MGALSNVGFASPFKSPLDNDLLSRTKSKGGHASSCFIVSRNFSIFSRIYSSISETGSEIQKLPSKLATPPNRKSETGSEIQKLPSKPTIPNSKSETASEIQKLPSKPTTPNSKNRMEEYNIAMKKMMRNPYEYHHDLGMNYTLIAENLIVGSQPQKPEDIDHLKKEEKVAYILNLQQDSDVEYWGIDLQEIIKRCRDRGIRHMRRPARDFDPDSLRSGLPKAVSSLEWAISDGRGRVYVHCTAGLGRAPAVAIAYMYWFSGMNLNTAYETLTSKRPCGPNKRAIRGATYDLAKNDMWKEPFENLPDYAFEDVAGWERNLIQERVRTLRGT